MSFDLFSLLLFFFILETQTVQIVLKKSMLRIRNIINYNLKTSFNEIKFTKSSYTSITSFV